jgi:hypothetical protein
MIDFLDTDFINLHRLICEPRKLSYGVDTNYYAPLWDTDDTDWTDRH